LRVAGLTVAFGLVLLGCTTAEPAEDPEAAMATSTRVATPSARPTAARSPSPTSWPATPPPVDLELAREVVADGLREPVYVTAPPNDPRLFVVEKAGRIRIIEDGRPNPKAFLDIRKRVRAGGSTSEQGLLALAFHPEYASSGRFFVHYTSRPDGDTRVVEYRVWESDPDRADEATRRTILRVDQPFRWHNGGMLMFGPDGMLWLGLGDGGVKNDPDNHGQNPRTLLGTILRLDVDARPPGQAYGIPSDNPFANGKSGAPEVWATGLRNPWRFDIDPRRRLLYIADVGEYRFEEINVVHLDRRGPNFGWAVREGAECFSARDTECASKGFVDPALAYLHEDSCAVVGGVVYRGEAIPHLLGHYFYTDFCNGRIRSFRYNARGRIVGRRDWTKQLGRISLPTSFGLDADGELYITSADGTVSRIVRVSG
jgi:glucose/arabinose dehydrogenase